MSDITAFIVPGPEGAPAAPASECPCAKAKTYYGNAEPEGKTVIVGGTEVVVGGWAAYEATRRQARWEANPHSRAAQPLSNYSGRTYITGQDALESLIGARVGGGTAQRRDPLARAAERLAAAIEAFEGAIAKDGPSVWARLGIPPDSPVAVSTISAEDVRYAVPETDVHELHRAAEDAGIFTSNYARDEELGALRAPRPPGSLPPLPSREVAARGTVRQGVTSETTNRNIARLEAATVPRASAVEAYRGEVAAVFDASAAVLERAVGSDSR
jgi:hypothetical protein